MPWYAIALAAWFVAIVGIIVWLFARQPGHRPPFTYEEQTRDHPGPPYITTFPRDPELIQFVGGPVHGRTMFWSGGDICEFLESKPISIIPVNSGTPAPSRDRFITYHRSREPGKTHEFIFEDAI